MSKGWIGVDLDHTLVKYSGFKGPGHIGEPIPLMVARITHLLAEGQDVRIFTARVSVPEINGTSVVDYERQRLRIAEAKEARAAIEVWTREVFGRVLPVTCVKDFSMWYMFDDRAKQVVPDTGELIEELYADALAELRYAGEEVGRLTAEVDRLERELTHAQGRMVD